MDGADELDLSRREFMQVGTVSALGLSSGSPAPEQVANPKDEYEFQAAAHLIGPASARPSPGDGFFDNKKFFAYVYEDITGSRSLITQDDSAWTPLNYIQQQNIFSANDLPGPTNGTHTLSGSTAYIFNGFVASSAGLDISNGPALLGRHGSVDGFIHTGGNTAITGTNGGLFMRNMYCHAPGGTLFDLTADQSTECLVESTSYSDAAGLGQMASLGTITGYRVPSFKGCNFEDFAGGLTFDGSPDKIFFSQSPFRTVTASGVTILTLAGTINVDVVDFVDNYIKGVQSDTVVWNAESGATINEIFQYRGTTHDSSVVQSNILTGEVGADAVGTNVADSYPLADSTVTGDLDLDAGTAVSGSGAGPAEIAAGNISRTTTLVNAERTSKPAEGRIQYDGKSDRKTVVHVNVSVSGSNTEVSIYIGLNGSVIQRSEVKGFLPNNSSPVGAVALAEVKLTQGDVVSAYLENRGGNKDLTTETLALTV